MISFMLSPMSSVLLFGMTTDAFLEKLISNLVSKYERGVHVKGTTVIVYPSDMGPNLSISIVPSNNVLGAVMIFGRWTGRCPQRDGKLIQEFLDFLRENLSFVFQEDCSDLYQEQYEYMRSIGYMQFA